jgi:hypothetical protein
MISLIGLTYNMHALLPSAHVSLVNKRQFSSVGRRYSSATPYLLFHMDPFDNLDPSLVHQYDMTTPKNDIHRAPPMTQEYQMFQRPPGAETRGPLPPPPPHTTHPFPSEHSFQDSLLRGHTEIGEHTNSTLKPFPIASQSDESNNAFYVPSPSRSASLSPSDSYILQASVSGKSQCSAADKCPSAEAERQNTDAHQVRS